MMKHLLTLLNLILIAVVCYLGVDIFYGWVSSKLVAAPFSLSANTGRSSGTDQAVQALPYYNPINQRNLFNIKTDAPAAPPKPVPVEQLKQTELKLKLWGTVTGTDGRDFAVIESKGGQQQLYHSGDAIENATVKSILREKVILHVNGKDEILQMETESSPARARAPQRISRPAAGQNISIKRSMIEDASRNIPQLLQQVNVRPYFENGKPSGLMLSRIRPNSIFREMGLMNGDILLGVNGERIESVDSAMKLYENLKSAGDVKVEIKRRGRIQTLEYAIK